MSAMSQQGNASAVIAISKYKKKDHERALELLFRCPNSNCNEVFLGYYKQTNKEEGGNGKYSLVMTGPKVFEAKKFSETIKSISSSFTRIYNQTAEAEEKSLFDICGPGYRKALEFLIKDYVIVRATTVEDKEAVKNEFLGKCIQDRINDTRIKEVARRAAWLGNDETHYVRTWEEKDLQDLKNLIDLTVHWIEAEALTEKLLNDMPSKITKKKL